VNRIESEILINLLSLCGCGGVEKSKLVEDRKRAQQIFKGAMIGRFPFHHQQQQRL